MKSDGRLIDLVEKIKWKIRNIVWETVDLLAFTLSIIFSIVLLYEGVELPFFSGIIFIILGYVIFCFISHWVINRKLVSRYSFIEVMTKLILSTFGGVLVSAMVVYFIFKWYSWRFVLLSLMLTTIMIVVPRLLWQLTDLTRSKHKEKKIQREVVLIGAGDGSSYFMNFYRKIPGDIKVIGMLDADQSKHNQVIDGIKVLGDRTELPKLIEKGVTEVIIANPLLEGDAYEELVSYCNQLGVKVNKILKTEEIIQETFSLDTLLSKVEIADLLGRKEVKLNELLLREELENKVILITGAGGSIGSEIVRQVSRFNPKKILLLGHGENSIYHIYHEMLKNKRKIQYIPIIADIQDKERIVQILRDEQPDILYHAAAHKHVPLMEMNPIEAYKNNIIGTYHVAKAVDETGVKKMVMISSDKAVNPSNVMGASKRVAELIITGLAKKSQSVFCAVRCGNVLGSRGSVIPLFEKQIAEGGPVTVTDFRMTRYFMTIPEASSLVIHAGVFAKSGEVFVLDMGAPVKIVDLARKVILLHGYQEHEIKIIESGIRPGEKLFEELLLSSEKVDRQINEQIFVGNVVTKSIEEIDDFIKKLQKDNPQALKEAIVTFANIYEKSMRKQFD